MSISRFIMRAREACPLFGGRVAGAASYAAIESGRGLMKTPCLYFIPNSCEFGENESETGVYQSVTEVVSAIAVLDNTVDDRGQANATTSYDDLLPALQRCFLGWYVEGPAHDRKPCAFVNAEHIGMDRALYHHEFAIAHLYYISSDTDGVQDDDGTPLVAADFDFHDVGNTYGTESED